MNAAKAALNSEIKRRLTMILNAKPDQITLSETGQILWQQKVGSPLPGEPVALLQKSDQALKPAIELIECDLLNGSDKEKVLEFLKSWLDTHIKTVLEPLIALESQDDIEGAARGIAFQVYENMGIVPREKLEDLIKDLDQESRAPLRARKIKMGPILVFLPALNKPAAVRLRALLWALANDKTLPVNVPNDGIVSTKVDPKEIDHNFYQAIGYPVFGGRAIRIDMLDRVISAVYDSAKEGKFQAQHKMAEWLGCPIEDLYDVLKAMGHKKIYDPADEKVEEETKVDAVEESSATKQVDPSTDARDDETRVLQGDKPEEAKPAEPKKPELATFVLKKGKAFQKSNSQNKPFVKKNNFDPKNKKEGKRAKRGNPKGKEYKQKMMTAEAKKDEADNPFAALAALKKSSDG